MPASSIIAWNNLAKAATITASSSVAGMPGANVTQDQGSSIAGWQTAAGVTAATLTIAPAGARQTWGALGVFRTNLTPSAAVSFALWNTGAFMPTLVWPGIQANINPVRGYGQAVAVPPDGTAADYLVITISDNGNPDGFLNVPLAFAGPAWYPAVGISWTAAFGRDDQTDEFAGRGGQEFPVNRWTRRRFDMRLEGIRQAEFWSQQAEIDRFAGRGGNVLVIPNTASPTIQQEAVFGRLKATADVTFPSMAGDARAWSASVTERL